MENKNTTAPDQGLDNRDIIHHNLERRSRSLEAALYDKTLSVDEKDSSGATPLHWACCWENVTAIQQLLDSGADINSATDGGWTPLHWACERGQINMVEALLKRGAKISKSTPSGWTPLDCALLNGRLNAVAMLLSGQYGAASSGAFGLNGSPNLEGYSFVYNPCLLPICFNKDDSSYVDIKRLLLQFQDNVLVPDIHELTRQFPWSQGGVSASGLAQELRRRPLRVNEKDSIGATPLHWACVLQKLWAVHLLLYCGAHINSVTDGDWTPLHWACERGLPDVALLLLRAGASVHCTSSSGWSPLDCATHHRHTVVAELLFAAGGVSGVGYAASRFQACEDNAPICFGNFSAKELLRMRSQLKDALASRQLQHGEILPPPDFDFDKCPNAFICPISYQLMEDPVSCVDGHSYDRSSIQKWLDKSCLSPKTGLRLNSKMLTTNFGLRAAIQEHFIFHAALRHNSDTHASPASQAHIQPDSLTQQSQVAYNGTNLPKLLLTSSGNMKQLSQASFGATRHKLMQLVSLNPLQVVTMLLMLINLAMLTFLSVGLII